MCMLAPTQNLSPDSPVLRFPLLASPKLDGFRCVMVCGKLFTTSMRPHRNPRLAEHLADLCRLSDRRQLVFDCELYDQTLAFEQLQSVLQGDRPIPATLAAHVFDVLSLGAWVSGRAPRFERRVEHYRSLVAGLPHVAAVPQTLVHSSADLQRLFDTTVADGHEGLVVRNPRGGYRQGRQTAKSGLLFKLKRAHTDDCRVVGLAPSGLPVAELPTGRQTVAISPALRLDPADLVGRMVEVQTMPHRSQILRLRPDKEAA